MNLSRFFVVAGLLLAPALTVGQAPAVTTDEPHKKTHCKDPKILVQVDPPRILFGWPGKEPKTVMTKLSITIDKNGNARDPVVIESGGPDVDKYVIEAVLKWKFTPKKCGKDRDPVETNVQILIPTLLMNGKPK